MKKLVVIAIALLFGVVSYAQDSEFNKMMREMYADEFKDIMMENINLTEAQMTVFKPIFNDFLVDLSVVMDNKLATQGKFSKYFDGMTDEQVKLILNDVVDNSKAYNKIIEKYTKKVGKELNPQTAFRFFLIVEKVKATIDYPMIQNLPLVKN
jgi:hypothetical protein